MVLATILLHNMMVEDQVNNDQVENGSMCMTVDKALDPKGSGIVVGEAIGGKNGTNENIESSGYNNNIIDHADNYLFVHKRWEEFYEYKGFMALQDATMRHVYPLKLEMKQSIEHMSQSTITILLVSNLFLEDIFIQTQLFQISNTISFSNIIMDANHSEHSKIIK